MVRLDLARTLTALGPFTLVLRRNCTDLRATSAFGPTMIGAPESFNVQFLMTTLEIVTAASLHPHVMSVLSTAKNVDRMAKIGFSLQIKAVLSSAAADEIEIFLSMRIVSATEKFVTVK